jgi:hypothetical protein
VRSETSVSLRPPSGRRSPDAALDLQGLLSEVQPGRRAEHAAPQQPPIAQPVRCSPSWRILARKGGSQGLAEPHVSCADPMAARIGGDTRPPHHLQYRPGGPRGQRTGENRRPVCKATLVGCDRATPARSLHPPGRGPLPGRNGGKAGDRPTASSMRNRREPPHGTPCRCQRARAHARSGERDEQPAARYLVE